MKETLTIETKLYPLSIIQTNTGKGGTFKMHQNDIVAGELIYKWSGKTKIIIEHTGVEENFKGQGIGKKLVLAAVDFARKNAIKILPLCTYAKAVFNKNPEIHDVLF